MSHLAVERGLARARPLGDRAGSFSFFAPETPDAAVKLLDGTASNGHFWLFHAALSDAAWDLTVLDGLSGEGRRSSSLLGQLTSFGDTEAFPSSVPESGSWSLVRGGGPSPSVESAPGPASCTASATRLCLVGGRFAVEVLRPGAGGEAAAAVATGDGHGLFSFFAPANPEVVVKILDGGAVNGHFWVFAGSLSNLGFSLSIRDTVSGRERTWDNPGGRFLAAGDILAFRSPAG